MLESTRSTSTPERASGASRRSISSRTLGFWGIAFVSLMTLGGYVAYRELLRYDRHAIEHVPPGADLALRVDLEMITLFEPIRRHLLPLLDQAPLDQAGHGTATGRLQRLREEAGFNLTFDLRELSFARTVDGGWLLGLGGIFDREHTLERIERTLASEAGPGLRRESGMLVLGSSGVALAQAEDGILLVGSSAPLVAQALLPSDNGTRLGVLHDGAASAAVLGAGLPSVGQATSGVLSTARRISARLELGDPLHVDVDVELATPGDAAALRREVESLWQEEPGQTGFVPRADWGGERAVLARATFTQLSDSRIHVSSTWERSDLDRAARSLAAWLQGRFHAHGPAAPAAFPLPVQPPPGG